MLKILLSTVAIAAISNQALAADLPSTKAPPAFTYAAPVAAYSWTGFYAGVEGGVNFSAIRGPFDTANGAAPHRSTATGGLLGGLVGYNYQVGSVVFGLEGNADGVLGGRRTTSALDPAGNAYGVTGSSTYNADARGRLGLALDRSLFYVAGGAAFGNANTAYSGPALATPAVFNSDRFGWTVGAGWDYAFTNNLIGRVEYRYTDLGRAAYANVADGFTDRTHFDSNAVLVGLMYKFGAPQAPVAAKY